MSSTGQPDPGVRADSGAVAERYRALIHRYVSRLAGDAGIADDLTQETFLRAHQHLDRLKDPGALEAWLYRIATNVCYDRFRSREHRQPAVPLPTPDVEGEDAVAEEDALRPDHLLEQREMSDCVLRFLVELPPAHRQVLLLHDLQGYTNPEIAAELGLSLQNVKIRLHRARARLRAVLAEACRFACDARGVFICEPKPR